MGFLCVHERFDIFLFYSSLTSINLAFASAVRTPNEERETIQVSGHFFSHNARLFSSFIQTRYQQSDNMVFLIFIFAPARAGI